MPFELLVTSLVGLASGIVSLYTDSNDKRYKLWQLVLLSLIIISAGSTVYFGHQKERESKITEANKDAQIKSLSDSLSLVSQNTKIIRSILEPLGWSQQNLNNQDQSQVVQSLKASNLLAKNRGDSERRGAITVQYFPKNVDPTIVTSRLEALGINLKPSPSQLSGVPTNAIWFGSGVDLNTVKAVAYTLIGAGVELKMIRQFNNSQGRELLIQVGGDAQCLNRPVLTVEKISSIQKFPQQNTVVNCQAVN